jgi:hypothetical protein
MPICVTKPFSRAIRVSARLEDVMRERLLAVAMFAQSHRGVRDGPVHVVGHGHIDGINLPGLPLKQLPPVAIDTHARKSGTQFPDATQIHFRHRHELHPGVARQGLDITPRHASSTDAGMSQHPRFPCGEGRRQGRRHSTEAGGLEKVTPAEDRPRHVG